MKIKRVILVMLILISSLLSKGQQDPMYTQYIFNLQTINPAYAGSWQSLGFMALTRLQWAGLKGHPVTNTFSFQTPLKSQHVGIGFNVIHDVIGLEKRITLAMDYSYQIFFSDVTSLRFGVKGGFTNYNNNLTEYNQYPDGQSDPLFQMSIENKFMPNFGFGLYFSAPRYYLSLSLPKIIENSYQSNENNFSTKSDVRHFFFAGGVVLDLSDKVKFKPTFMTKAVMGAPFQYDLSANFLLDEKFWLGGMYRSGDSFGAIAQWIPNQKLRIGYAYDFTTTNLKYYHHGVHELMVSYEIAYTRRKYTSPRYF